MFRGKEYQVDQTGRIKVDGEFSNTRIFLGGSTHHWCKFTDVTLDMAFKNPSLLDGCLGWDTDHGAVRRWGGRYNGKLPRISGVYVQ